MALAPLFSFAASKQSHYGIDFVSELDHLFDEQGLVSLLFQFHWNKPTHCFSLCERLITIHHGQPDSLIKEPLRLLAAICGDVFPKQVLFKRDEMDIRNLSYMALVPATPETMEHCMGILKNPEFITECRSKITLEFDSADTAILRTLIPPLENRKVGYYTELVFMTFKRADEKPRALTTRRLNSDSHIKLLLTFSLREENPYWRSVKAKGF